MLCTSRWSLAGSPFARAAAGMQRSSTAARSPTRLAKRVHGKEDNDDTGSRAGGKCQERGDQHERDVAPIHPLALSTSRTVNGALPAGVTSKDSPQWPTITSAGAERE